MAALFWLFFGWARETAAVSAHVLCTPYNQAPVHSVIRSHIANVLMYLQITCHLHFRQNDRELLGATAVTADTEIGVSIETDPGETNSPAAPAGDRTRDLSMMSSALYH